MNKKTMAFSNLCDICQCFFASDNIQDLMNEIVRNFSEYFDFKGAIIRLMDKQWKTLEVGAHFGLSTDYIEKGPVMIDQNPIDIEVLKGKTIAIKDTSKEQRIQYPEKIKKEGFRSIICLPIKSKKHIYGVLRGYSTNHRKFDDDEIDKMEIFAKQSAMAYESHMVLERSKKLHEISKVVNSSLELSTVLSTIVKLATESMKAKASTIRLLDEQKHQMVIKTTYGLSKAFLEKGPFNIEDLPIDQEVLKGKVVYIPQVTKDSRYIFPELAKNEGIVSVLCVPLKSKDRFLGTLRVYTATEYEFSEEEKDFLLTLANEAAIAVNNAILYERMHTLFLVTKSLSKSLELHQLFKIIVEGATKAMNAQGCVLMIWNNENNQFNMEESFGINKEFLKIFKEDYIDCSKEIICGEQVIKSNLGADFKQRSQKAAIKEGIKSFINMPMKAKEHLTGIIQIYFTTSREFNSDEIEFFSVLANEAAVAIENAMLYEAINKKYNHLVEDIFLWYDGTSRGMDY